MTITVSRALIGLVLVWACSERVATAAGQVTALVGGTLVDVSDRGRAGHDVPNATVLIQDGVVLAAGPGASISVPGGATVVSAKGLFIIPGLVDGFTGLQNQAEADAMLAEGVTTVVGSGDDRRGRLFEHADPSPHLYELDSAGSTDDWSLLRDQPAWHDRLADGGNPKELTPAETTAQLEATAKRGTRVVWIGHNITAANTNAIITQSHKLGMVTYGELIATPYPAAILDGVDSLLHMSRYELGLAPASTLAPLVGDPEGPAAGLAYAAAVNQPPDAVRDYARVIAGHDTALMPTLALFYLELPGHRNLWKEPAAAKLDVSTLAFPSDKATGEEVASPAEKKQLANRASALFFLNQLIEDVHPLYLAASGASVFGALPGIALHVEMEMLVRLGLTPREALAAATSNYADKFGWRELGGVMAGRRADLVLLGADPTADIRNVDRIEGVFLAGVKLERK